MVSRRPLEAIYGETRARIVGVVVEGGTAAAARAAATPVPACPSWSVHDVLAHVTALYSDIMSGNIAGAATDAWTAAQVERRRPMTIDELLAESDDVGPKLAAMIDDFPGRYGVQIVADLAVHEQDIRGALGCPGARDSRALSLATDFLFGSIIGPGAKALGLDPIQLRAGSRSWVVGTDGPPAGEPEAVISAALASAEPEPAPDHNPVGTVAADPFELFRALTGRRSATQIRRFEWTLDPEPYLSMFHLWPFTLRGTNLEE